MTDTVIPFRPRQDPGPPPAPNPGYEIIIHHDGRPILALNSVGPMVYLSEDAEDRDVALALMANALWVISGGVERIRP